MNEELKIVIKAITEEAQRELEGVKKELEKINQTGDETSEGLSESFSKVSKAALVAVGAITAVVGSMIALTKSSMEFQKANAKLIASFQAVGSSAAQANTTYKELYGFLGDVDTATEAAQSLALITTNTKDLAEWTEILQGAYALMGSKLPTEGLAEAANETIKTGTVTGNLADALNWLGVSEDAVNSKLATLNAQAEREAYLRELLNGLYSNSAALYERNNAATIAYNQSQADLDIALARATEYVIPLLTHLNNLGATLLQVLAPAFRYVATFVAVFVEYISAAIQFVAAFFGLFADVGSSATESVAQGITEVKSNVSGLVGEASGLGGAFDEAAEAAKELKRQTMGFDELNVVGSNSSAAASSGAPASSGGGVGALSLPDMGKITGIEEFKKDVEELRAKMQAVLVLAGLTGAAIGAWKLTNFIKGLKDSTDNLEKFKSKMKNVGGIIMIAAGAILLVNGYSDAWVNGIDWGNFALILSGIGLIIGGLVVAISPLAGAIGTITGGIAMLILGIKDLIENGYSMEAVIMVAVGAITVMVGAIWAFNSALLANPITWVVAAIVALGAAFVVLWNECEAFRNFWIGLWDGIVSAFNATVKWLGDACNSIGKFFSDAWVGIKNIWNAVPNFFANIWTSIKQVFSKVGTFFTDVFRGAWNGIKSAFSTAGNIFVNIKDGIVTAFKTVVNGLIEGINRVVRLPFDGLNGILNTIQNINILGLKPFGWLSWRAPVPQLPKLATGGIVNSATVAMIGERGKEAVLPLENNTGWMDTLAERIASKQSTPSKIVLMLDSRELGWANIKSINGITEQTGQLQLALY